MSERVLVVDDDPSICETFEVHLGEQGYEVVAVQSAEEALNRIADFDPSLVIVDFKLPGMDGLEFLRRLTPAPGSPGVPAAIVITAHQDMESAVEAMRQGAYDYLVKPLDLDQIDLLVRRCLRERRQTLDQSPADPEEDEAPVARIIGRDPRMVEIFKTIGRVAQTRATVLIRGETGTGKGAVARAIHDHSPAAELPFIAVNCSALTETLLQSELFGHVRGAFTGAVSNRKGRFEMAGSGTIFLDEIGDTTPAFQSKLLRVLEERTYYPVGAETPRMTDARVIAATHLPIEEALASGEFREDLYFRLRVVEIHVPPLRDRRGDIPALTRHLLVRIARELDKGLRGVADEAMMVLGAHDWPGNVRELQNCLRRAAVNAPGATIAADHIELEGRDAGTGTKDGGGAADDPRRGSEGPDSVALEEIERAHVQRVLDESGGVKRRAAQILQISRPRLDRLIKKYGLRVTPRDRGGNDS
jgi:DNA-binding NtrC family response regulator